MNIAVIQIYQYRLIIILLNNNNKIIQAHKIMNMSIEAIIFLAIIFINYNNNNRNLSPAPLLIRDKILMIKEKVIK